MPHRKTAEKNSTLKEIIDELERIKYYALELDNNREKNYHVDDLKYALQKLEEVRTFLEPTEYSPSL